MALGDARVVLHIGPHKTGSTFLQSLFARHREALREEGLAYPGHGINHNAAYLYFCDAPQTEHEMIRAGCHSVAAAKAHAARGRTQLEADLAACGDARILLSAEEFCRLSSAGIARLLAFLRPYGPVHVIAFARQAEALILSDAQEAIKGGLTFADLQRDLPSPGYRRHLEGWHDAAGPSRMTVMAFPPAEPLDRIMARLLGIAPFPGADSDRRENVSLTLNGAMVLSAINAAAPPFLGNRVNSARARIPQTWLAALPGPRFRLPPDMLDRALQSAEADMAWLQARFDIPVGAAGLAASSGSDQAPDDGGAALDSSMAKALGHLLHRLAHQLNSAAAEALVAQAAPAQDDAAERLLRRAIQVSPGCIAAHKNLAALLNRHARTEEARDLLAVAADL